MVVCTMIKQVVICIMIKHTLVLNLQMGTFGVEIKVKIKMIKYVCIHYITDGSTKGLRTCLMQNNMSISYARKLLTKTELNCSYFENEFLAVIFGLEHFKPFYYGCPIIVKNNHKSLKKVSQSPSHWCLLASRECSYKSVS